MNGRLARYTLPLALALGSPRPLLAQCPDGAPPPCAGAAPRAAATRPPDPRTWVVLPFANVTREPEIAWLQEAAVNLLYLDLSRWTDIRVVDDGRVADAVRRLPTAERAAIGLATGLGLARRHGAGRLVMGDLVRNGPQTTILAKVYDVSNGQRLRTVREDFTSRETTMPAFERLAGKVLDARLPDNVRRDAVGTTSLDAYQEYAAGLTALRAWNLDTAYARFSSAIRRDSTFALAHYRLSVAIGWLSGSGDDVVPPAEAATRYAAGLPARERALIQGQDQFVHNRYVDACTTFRGLVAADSGDVEAWYQLGECSFHDGRWEPVNADSTSWRPRASKTESWRAFQRTLSLDPEMHLAYEHLIDLLKEGNSPRCPRVTNNRCTLWLMMTSELRDDSIVVTSRVLPPDSFPPPDSLRRRANLLAAVTVAQRWLAAAPDEAEAHFQYSSVLSGLGRLSDAVAEIAAARRLGVRSQPFGPPVLQQIQLLIRTDSTERRTLPAAALLADSVLSGHIPLAFFGARPEAVPFLEASLRAVLAGAFGSLSRVPSHIPLPRWSRDTIPDGYYRTAAATAVGVAPRAGSWAALAGLPAIHPLRRRAPTVLRYLCDEVCTVSAELSDSAWSASPLGLALAGDHAAARVALRTQDSGLAAAQARGGVDTEFLFRSARAHLALRDTAGAVEALRRFDRELSRTDVVNFYHGYPLGSHSWLLGRAWLLTADLAAATGRRDDANLFYRRVVDLWSHADAELQPFVQRARAALPENQR